MSLDVREVLHISPLTDCVAAAGDRSGQGLWSRLKSAQSKREGSFFLWLFLCLTVPLTLLQVGQGRFCGPIMCLTA